MTMSNINLTVEINFNFKNWAHFKIRIPGHWKQNMINLSENQVDVVVVSRRIVQSLLCDVHINVGLRT